MAGTTDTRVAIIGAGPAGVTAAISLAREGIPSILIDQSQFPRPKICGDGLSGKVVSNLKRLDPGYLEEFTRSGIATASKAARFYAPDRKMMELTFQPGDPATPPGFICKRIDFDEFMLNKALGFKEISFRPDIQISTLKRENDSITLLDEKGKAISNTKLLLFAAGANRKIIRQLDPSYPGQVEEGIGVRGYFENVTGADEKHAIEIHFLSELLPWYLWIFPFEDGSANVGLALPEYISIKKDLSLKELLFKLIETYPDLKSRFTASKLKGKIEAARLPYYNSHCKVAGDNYLLLGDAARLVDPFTGEGIGNAMASGHFASRVAQVCLEENDFSINQTGLYQKMIDSRLVPDLALGYKLQKLARNRLLMNLVIGRAFENEKTRQKLSEMLYNQDAKRKLKQPGFYIKLLLGL
jgi:geranylgeranyl reductase family protein